MKIQRRKLKVEIPSVAMGDIAFNLLVFFVILANPADDVGKELILAKSQSVEDAGRAPATIAIDANNDLYLNGRQIGIAELAMGLEDALRTAPAEKRRVHLRIHHETLAQRFEPVLMAVSEAGGDMWHILDKEAPPGSAAPPR